MDKLLVTVDALSSVLLVAKDSPILFLLHSIAVAYVFRMRAETYPTSTARAVMQSTWFRRVVVHLIISLGGGTLAAVLTGTPCNAVVNGQILPSYLLGYILVNHMDPIFWLLANAPGLDFILLAIIDPTARVLGMASVINSRFPPTVQWALAIIIACGGGMIYRVQFARDYVIHNHVYVLGSLAAILVSLNHPALHPSWLNMDPIRTVVLVNVYAVLLFSLLYVSSSASVPTTPTSPTKPFVLRNPPMISKNQSNQTSAAASPVKERKEESPTRSPRATRSLRSRKKD